jgi:class 3 adenylate cyclase
MWATATPSRTRFEEFFTHARSGADADVRTITVLFTDIVASTEHQARVGLRQWSRITDQHDALVRGAFGRHRDCEVRATGDGFLATFNAAGRALRCAAEILAGAKDIGLTLRAGVRNGEVEVRGEDIAGLAVTIAKRVCDLAGPGQVLMSESMTGLVAGSGISAEDGGDRELKGVPGVWRLFGSGLDRRAESPPKTADPQSLIDLSRTAPGRISPELAVAETASGQSGRALDSTPEQHARMV